MNSNITQILIKLNHQFYQTLAGEFSATRQRLQPGVQRILADLQPEASILDLGCGNGEVRRSLIRRGHTGKYAGLDFSNKLLQEAGAYIDWRSSQARFIQADLSSEDWDSELPDPPYDVVLAFAVLHHLPSQALRLQTLCKVRHVLRNGGRFYHSNWQFLNSPRLRARILPWETIGLSQEQVEAGDYLLDWRRGGYGVRYVHCFSETELWELANQSGFQILETFYSDGEGGRLGLYQVWS